MSDFGRKEKERLRGWCAGLGIPLSGKQLDACLLFLNELWEWNRKINLTGLSSRNRILSELLLDSLVPASYLPETGRLLDAGSGAGFPAIPLKIRFPGLETHLVESGARKAVFLRHVARTAGLRGITVLEGRIGSDDTPLRPGTYHVVTARALADLSRTVAWCAPYLRDAGLFLSFQGKDFTESLSRAAPGLRNHGLDLLKIVRYRLPAMTASRHLLIFEKRGPGHDPLSRQQGKK